ncbi:MAG: YceI family protein [Pseudomonadota bacterium]
MNTRLSFAVLASTLFLAFPAAAQWALSPDESRIGFVSVKAGDFPESHYFGEMQGTVSQTGEAEITISLDSVETNIDIRNERMREFLFETDKFPTATIAAAIDLDALNTMQVGARKSVDFTGELTLHGASAPVETTLTLTRIAETRVLVETTDPVILYADQFELSAGIKKLMELASLPSITPAVPVAVSLVFEREK